MRPLVSLGLYFFIMKRFFIILLFISACLTSEARNVKGSVRCGSQSIEGVIVTDGYGFAVTDRKGRFVLDIKDDAEFVHIVTPAGYVADWSSGVPAFYMPASGRTRFDFKLRRTASGDDYHIIAVSDPQTHTDAHFAEFAAEPLEDMAQTAKGFDGAAVGLVLGDISWDRIEILDMYRKAIVGVGIPFYPVVGNHDNQAHMKGDSQASAAYRSKMGPENYAFCLGKDVVIVLDNIIYGTDFKCTIGYTEEVIAWVENLMPLLPSDACLYIAQHSPLSHEGSSLVNQDKLLFILKGRNVNFLSGHTHVNGNEVISSDIFSHNVAAICGAWWDTKHCKDGTPRGYKVLSNAGGDLSWYYKPVGYPRYHIAETSVLGPDSEHPGAIVVNVWDWDPLWKVEWAEDGVAKGLMKQVSVVSPVFASEIKAAYDSYGKEVPRWKSPKPSPHNFIAIPSPSSKTVTISIETRFGQKWTTLISL